MTAPAVNASIDFSSRIARPVLVTAGIFALAVITLHERGATAMYATPWRTCYWIAVTAPFLLLGLRLFSTKAPLRLPTRPWRWLGGCAFGAIVAAAGFSPYRGSVVLWSMPPLSGIATFLLAVDWLQESPQAGTRLAHGLAMSAGVVMLAAAGYWLVDLSSLEWTEILSGEVFEMRLPHPLGHANYTAGLALLALPWLALAARTGKRWTRWTAAAVAGVTLVVLFLSGSRGGLVGLGVLGVASFAVSQPGWRRFFRLAPWVLVGALALAFANPRVRHFFERGDEGAAPNLSTVQRSAMLTAAWRMGADRPLTGWGLHSTPLVYPRYRAGLAGGADSVLQLHSTPAELWAGMGLPGIALLGAFAGIAIRNWSRAPAAAATLAGYGAFALTDYQLDVPVFVAATALLAAQLAVPGETASKPNRILGGGILTTMVGAFIWWGRPDPTPRWNAEALNLARDPQQHAQAVGLLEASLRVNPIQELPHFNLGWLLVVSDPAAAERHFRAAAQLVPDKGGVYFGLGLARLNQGKHADAALAFALECINDPRFVVSPWWNEPAIGAERAATQANFDQGLRIIQSALPAASWAAQQAGLLRGLQGTLGEVSSGPEHAYRRERIGYPVLVRNQDLGPIVDLYDVREHPRIADRVPFPLPPKGWVPSPLMLKLLDEPVAAVH